MLSQHRYTSLGEGGGVGRVPRWCVPQAPHRLAQQNQLWSRSSSMKDHRDGPPADPQRLRSRQLPGVGASCPQEPCPPCSGKPPLPAPLTPVRTASPGAPSSAEGSQRSHSMDLGTPATLSHLLLTATPSPHKETEATDVPSPTERGGGWTVTKGTCIKYSLGASSEPTRGGHGDCG